MNKIVIKQSTIISKLLSLLTVLMVSLVFTANCQALDDDIFIDNKYDRGDFTLASGNELAVIMVDSAEDKGVLRAVKDLLKDMTAVTGKTPVIENSAVSCKNAVIIGTVGSSSLIDKLIADGKIDVSSIKGKWESYIIQTVDKPLSGIDKGLVIVGSDRRAAIFGIYTISEQIGVSPWYWWADVPIKKSNSLFATAGKYESGEPAVQYRGIFLNDEAPALSGWTGEKFGGFNSKFYVNVFELLLRLKSNFLWPAMWGRAFNSDDPMNPVLAHEYGIVMSTSHHEPMMRAQADWNSNRSKGHAWDYSKEPEVLREFWRGGLEKVKDYDKVITLAMRGDGDEPMTEGQNVALLEKIVADQRKIIADVINPDVTKVPQVWALYKEVQGYYERGMRVPDDVTLLWCDDNWGNIRRLPTAEERKRSGGAGVYYHFDYVGGPRSYRWINTNPIPKIWEQMSLAYDYDARKIWVVNVGDLKPMEFPIEYFLTLAWNPEKWPKERIKEYSRLWTAREFGDKYADDIAIIIEKYTKLNGRCKPELMSPDVYSLSAYREAETILAEYDAINDKAQEIYESLPAEHRDAFFQLVLHPALASSIVTEMNIMTGLNRMYAEQGRSETNEFAQKVKDLFDADARLTERYHTFNGGKWNHMMSQTHIGYRSWDNPRRNTMPRVNEITVAQQAALGVAVEASTKAWFKITDQGAELPQFDRFGKQKYYIEVFNKGSEPYEFTASADMPWIKLSQTKGTVNKTVRILVDIDWETVPADKSEGTVSVNGTGQTVLVKVKTFNPEIRNLSKDAFVETDGYISIEPENYTSRIDTEQCRWEKIEEYGISVSGMSIFPTNVPSVAPGDGPALEYNTYLFTTGRVDFLAFMSPSLNIDPGRGVSIAVSIDDQEPKVIEYIPQVYSAGDHNGDWARTVIQNARLIKTSFDIAEPGIHTLKVWMVDPAVVIQKIVLDAGGLRTSRLGPPESPFLKRN